MAVRVADILRMPGLALRPAGGGDGSGRSIRWVHVSELEDPTPWLRGGELLLTTGMGLGATAARQRSYLRRLQEAGLAGLGLGTGFTWPKVPKALAAEADRLGFPVFEVPYPVPFIAITEAVSSRLLSEQHATLQRSLDAQGALTRILLAGGGVPELMEGLAAAVDGWAAVLNLHGMSLGAAPARARGRATRLWDQLREAREQAAGFSLSFSDRREHVLVQPVAVRERVVAFLAMGKPDAFSQFDRIIVNHALSLAAIELDKSRAVAEAERSLRGDFLDAIVAGTMGDRELARGLRRFGLDPAAPVAVLALRSERDGDGLAAAAEEVLSRRTGGFLISPRGQEVYLLMHPNGDVSSEGLLAEVASAAGTPVTAGAGSPVGTAEAARSLREARYALQVCRVEGRRFADFDALGTYRLLLTLQDPGALAAFADSVLAPLDRYDEQQEGDLIRSLSAFLQHNAAWEAASQELFVHRHTLRYRMRKVEELTGRDLATAHDRTEFWLALRARDLLAADAE